MGQLESDFRGLGHTEGGNTLGIRGGHGSQICPNLPPMPLSGLLLGRTERAARAAELQLCAQAR